MDRDTPNGGPVHWIHQNYVCPNCVTEPHQHANYDKCCRDNPNPEVNFCKPDPGRETYQPPVVGDDNEWGGCERWRFILGVDEMALPCEIGMYLDFNVTDDGIPYGCPGFNTRWTNLGIKYK